MSESSELLNKVQANYQRFNESLLRDEFKFSEGQIQALVDFGLSRDLIARYFHYECPTCFEPSPGYEGELILDSQELECAECSTKYSRIEELLFVYYAFSTKGSSGTKTRTTSSKIGQSHILNYDIPHSIDKFRGKEVSKYLRSEKSQLLWHISDLHFGKSGIWNPGHSENLLKVFTDSLLKARGGKKDHLFITGDLTTNGSAENVKMANNFIGSCGDIFEKIEVVPGNHDRWNGRWRINIFLGKLTSFFRTRKSADHFVNSCISEKLAQDGYCISLVSLNGYKVAIVSIDSTFRNKYALAQGIFPSDKNQSVIVGELSQLDFDFAVLLLHHHISPYEEPSNSNFKFIVHELGMRLMNSSDAKKFVRKNDIRLVLHGHRHVQFKEIMLTNNFFSLLCPAPAAFLDGEDPDGESVGFNLFKFSDNWTYLIHVKCDSGYVIDRICRFKSN